MLIYVVIKPIKLRNQWIFFLQLLCHYLYMVQWSPCLVHWTPRVGTNEPEPFFRITYKITKLWPLHFVLQCLPIILHKETVKFFENCSLQVENKKSGSMDPTLPYPASRCFPSSYLRHWDWLWSRLTIEENAIKFWISSRPTCIVFNRLMPVCMRVNPSLIRSYMLRCSVDAITLQHAPSSQLFCFNRILCFIMLNHSPFLYEGLSRIFCFSILFF